MAGERNKRPEKLNSVKERAIRARGVRKTPIEKLQGELAEVQNSIAQYENCLETMREREKALEDQIQLEEFKVVNEMLRERDMTMDDLKEMIAGGTEESLTA